MKYHDARDNIRSGDLLAWSHVRWGSWHDIKIQLVRFFTRSEYSHVAVAWVVAGRVFALEAVQPLVRIYPLSKLGDFYHVPLNAGWTTDTEEFALQHVGEPYSQLQAIAAFFRPLAHDGQWECAEYAANVLMRAGVDLGPISTPTAVVKQAQRLGAPCMYVLGDPS